MPMLWFQTDQFPVKNSWNLAEKLLHNRGPPRDGRRGRDSLPQMSHTQCSNPQAGGSSQLQTSPWGRKGWAPSQTLPTWESALQRWAPKSPALKTSGAYVQETQKALGNGESVFKGLMYRLTYTRTQCKNTNLKNASTTCEGDLLANLKEPPGAQESAGASSGDGGSSGCHVGSLTPAWQSRHWWAPGSVLPLSG